MGEVGLSREMCCEVTAAQGVQIGRHDRCFGDRAGLAESSLLLMLGLGGQDEDLPLYYLILRIDKTIFMSGNKFVVRREELLTC